MTKQVIDTSGTTDSLQSGGNKINANFTEMYDRTLVSQNNIALNAFRIAINGGLSVQNMQDGFVDEFEDETGVDTATSTNEIYDAVVNSYSPLPGVDADTLLHMDGADTSTTITDDGGTSTTWTAVGNAQLSTTSPMFGTASLLLDGTGDWVDTPAHAKFNMGAGEYLIDFAIKRTSTSGARERICGQADSGGANAQHLVEIATTNTVKAYFYSTAPSTIVLTSTATITDTAKHHIEVGRAGDTFYLFVDGNLEDSVSVAGLTAVSATNKFAVGQFGEFAGTPFNGRVDEFRTLKGTPCHTASFTPPESAYSLVTYNMTLASNSVTAVAQPDEASVILFEEDVDAVTLNADLIAKVSRDGGTTKTAVTLVDQGDYESGRRILQGSVDISGQPAGTGMEYEITTANNKDLNLHGVALQWA